MKKILLSLTITTPIALTGCIDLNSSDSATSPDITTQNGTLDENDLNSSDSATSPNYAAFIAGAAADYSVSSMAIVDAQNPSDIQTGLNSNTSSDVKINHYNQDFYLIYRYNANHITKYNTSAPTTPIWDCSTEGNDTNSNPYQIIQVASDKAYVLRYGTGKVWIVNPSISNSSQCATDFKTGEIDLSSFDDDGIPEMATGVYVNGKLYVGIQRLTYFSPDQNSQVVVINTADNSIEQTINLSSHNIQKLQYVPALNALYAVSVGKYAAWDGSAPAQYTGGVEKINLSDHSTQVVVDDNEDTQQISDMAIINENKGYFINYASYQNNTLYQFNPQTGEILSEANGSFTPIAGLASQNLANLSINPQNQNLWIGTTSGVTTVNTQTNTVEESLIDTQMNPTSMVFIEK